MRFLFRLFVVAPIALVLLLFAIANRHFVTVSFDPFTGGDIQGPSITAPLFLALTLAGVAGLLVGGLAVWLRQARWRRDARIARSDAASARAEADRLRAELAAARGAPAATGSALVPIDRRTAA